MKYLLFACLLAASLVPARAAAAPDPAIESARQHFEAGTRAFNRGDFGAAAVEYEAANQAKPDPFFLYNIAQAWRLAKEPRKAIDAYRAYLKADPTAQNRKEVEERIAQLQAQLPREPQPAPTRPQPATARPQPATVKAPEPPPASIAPEPRPAAAPVVTTRSAPADKPVYKKGWFWGVVVGVAVVAGVGVGLGVGLTRGPDVPDSPLGNQRVFLVGGAF